MGFLTIVSLLLYAVAHMDLGDSPRHTNVWVGVNSFIIVAGIFSVKSDIFLRDSHSLYGLTLSTVSVQQERTARRELDGDSERAAVLAAEMEIPAQDEVSLAMLVLFSVAVSVFSESSLTEPSENTVGKSLWRMALMQKDP